MDRALIFNRRPSVWYYSLSLTFAAMLLLDTVSLIDKIIDWDKWLFLKVNREWTNDFFDAIMPYMRDSNYWMPLYLFLFVFVLVNYGVRGWWWIVFFLCTVALCDIVSSQLIKKAFDRARPCEDPDIMMLVRMLVKRCSGQPSFTSSHAANHFGISTFFFLTFRHLFKGKTKYIFLWPLLIGYSQVYVGVHYPGDVFGGALIGLLFGCFTGMLFNKKFGFANFDKPTAS